MDSSKVACSWIDEPLVSVVIPVYNVKNYLPQCLESVLSQTYQNLEVLVVDDGSTDGSGSICDVYAQRDRRVQIFHTENNGLASARNLGIKSVNGKFLIFVDSDDWIEQHTIETLLSTIKQCNADIVVGGFCLEYVGETVHPEKNDEYIKIYRGEDILSSFADGIINNVVWNKLFSSSYIPLLNFPDGHNYEDVYVMWKLLKYLAEKNNTVVVLSEELFHFRNRSSSISHTRTMKNIVDSWRAYLTVFEGLPFYQKKLMKECFITINWMWEAYINFSKEERAEAEYTIQEMLEFSKLHFSEIMRGSFPLRIKLFCLISQYRSPFLMWLCHHGSRLRVLLKHNDKQLFE